MSREVVGQAPDEGVAPGAADRPDDLDVPAQRPAPEEEADPSGGRPGRFAVLAVAALLVGAVAGWTGGGLGTPARADPADDQDPVAVLVALTPDTGGATSGAADGETTGVATVLVTNPGTTALAIGSGQATFVAARPVLDAPARIGPRQQTELTVRVLAACGSPLPLALAPLVAVRTDGAPRPVVVHATAGALATLCETRPGAGDGGAPVVAVRRVHRDGDRLAVVVVVPSGRTVWLSEVSAGGTPLTGRPLPVAVDGTERTVWLDPPGTCAPVWSFGGLPQRLDLLLGPPVAGAGSARVVRDAGPELARWLLETSCGGGS